MLSHNTERSLIHLLLEAGMLKNIPRSGWLIAGIKNPETVAEHSFRCAVLGYILAHQEKVNAHTVLLMCLFNDIHEARISDLHKVSQRYFDYSRAEETAFHEQMSALPRTLHKELTTLRQEYVRQKSRESVIARDADILECLLQAKEYYDQGFKKARHFMKKAPSFLVSAGARRLWKRARSINTDQWWLSLSSFQR